MNHYPAQHLHDADPPTAPSIFAPNSPWSIPGAVERLKELWVDHSATQIAAILTQEFQTTITRNAVVGKLHRLKPTVNDKTRVSNRTQRAKRTDIPVNKPKLKIIRAAGNSSALKLIYSVETEAAPLQCVPVDFRHVPLLDLEPNDCRYPSGGDSAGEAITFCGQPQRSGSPYCDAHHVLCYRPAEARKERRVAA